MSTQLLLLTAANTADAGAAKPRVRRCSAAGSKLLPQLHSSSPTRTSFRFIAIRTLITDDDGVFSATSPSAALSCRAAAARLLSTQINIFDDALGARQQKFRLRLSSAAHWRCPLAAHDCCSQAATKRVQRSISRRRSQSAVRARAVEDTPAFCDPGTGGSRIFADNFGNPALYPVRTGCFVQACALAVQDEAVVQARHTRGVCALVRASTT